MKTFEQEFKELLNKHNVKLDFRIEMENEQEVNLKSVQINVVDNNSGEKVGEISNFKADTF